MSFYKIANVPLIGLADGQYNHADDTIAFTKNANSKVASVYQDTSSKIDIRGMLQMVADKYNISDNPDDYIFEAARAVTAEVPNENADAFPRSELLRFDHRLHKAVYQTFIGKPHHINHRADNPKTARGVVLDATYNDLAKVLDVCPGCGSDTTAVENRDQTGINCAKCGHTVKDEFVELLIAIDKKKDPTFAEGVKNGSLDSLSMGCFTAGTEITIDNGSTIPIEDVVVGTDVITHNGNIAKVVELSKRHYDGNIIDLDIFGIGDILSVTPNHPILVNSNGTIDWMHADHLTPGMIVLTPKVQSSHVDVDNYIARKINKVSRRDFHGDVYNFEVDSGDHSYIAGGIAVHNCEAGYTDCSICSNRARTVAQFCNHIKSGNKKKIFKTASGPKLSYEKCGEVVFSEISRVDQPADPKAKQYEVFSIQMPHTLDMLATRVAKLEAKLTRGAQLVGGDVDEHTDLLDKIEELKETHPELYMSLKKVLDPTSKDVPERMSIDDYEEKRQESVDGNMSCGEMGVKLDEGNLPMSAASKVASEILASFDNLLYKNKCLEEAKVSTSILKFAKTYRNLEASVTDKGNIRVFSPHGTLFVIRPEPKLTAENARRGAREVMTCIAENGLVGAMQKYKIVKAPKLAQILEHHVEDFIGRDNGGKKSIVDGGDTNMTYRREQPAGDLQDSNDKDHREKFNTPAESMTDDREADHTETLRSPSKALTDEATNDMNVERTTPPGDTLKDSVVDRKDSKSKRASMRSISATNGPLTAPATLAEGQSIVARQGTTPETYIMFHRSNGTLWMTKSQDPGSFDPNDAEKVDEFTYSQYVEEELQPGALIKVSARSKRATDKCSCGKDCSDGKCAEQSASKAASRIERLYKSRYDKLQKESEQKIATAENNAVSKLQGKFLRALKLASKRQALNLEESPLKAKMFDVLANKMDLDSDSYYPGMDAYTASHIVEATTSVAFDEFVDSIIKRASEFMTMSDEALAVIEADIKNLKPVAVAVQAEAKKSVSNDSVRRAAVDGNLIVAPSPTREVVPNTDKRNNIRSALDTTKVRRNSQALLK